MKNKIWIRLLCLLLCVSMVCPMTVVATGSLDEDEIQFHLRDGQTTNAMAYVDQLYNDDGSFSDTGEALLHWLKMTPENDEEDRIASGYLMLEQELEFYGRDKFFQFTDRLRNVFVAGIDMLSDFKGYIAGGIMDDIGFRSKFPKAGKSAYIYYNYFYEIYFDYIDKLQTAMAQADVDYEKLDEFYGDITSIDLDDETVEAGLDMIYTYIASRDLLVFGAGKSGRTVHYTLLGVENLNSTSPDKPMRLKVERGGQEQTLSVEDFARLHVRKGEYVSVKATGVKNNVNLNTVNQTIKSEMTRLARDGKIDQKRASQIEAVHVQAIGDTVKAADGELSAGVQNAVDASQKELEPDKFEIPEDVKLEAQKLGLAMNAVGVAVETVGLVENMKNLNARQVSYLNALATVTEDYAYMVTEWKARLDASSVSGKQDIKDALNAVLWEILDLRTRTVEEIAANDTIHFSEGALGSLLWGSVRDFTKDAGDLAKASAKVGTAVDSSFSATAGRVAKAGLLLSPSMLYSAVLNGFLGNSYRDMANHADNVRAIYNMKWSLYNLLAEDNDGTTSLLTLYPKQRNHQNATAIIAALQTMKSAKAVGENMMESYYLMDLYSKLGLKISPNVHMVVCAELMHNKRFYDLPTIPQIYAVYEDSDVKINNPGAINPTGDQLYEYSNVTTQILGYYLADPSRQTDIQGIPLQPLPARFANLPNYRPYTPDGVVLNRTTVLSQEWLDGKTPSGTNPQKQYKELVRLYSRYGVEVVLSEAEYTEYCQLEKKLESIYKRMNSGESIKWFEFGVEDQQQVGYRLEWLDITRHWIDSFEMYSEYKDYSKHSIDYYHNG